MDNIKHVHIRRLQDIHLVIPSMFDVLQDKTGTWKVIQRKLKTRIDEVNGEIWIDAVDLTLKKV